MTGTTTIDLDVDRVITYSYDDLYRLTGASYSTGESYAYEYDPVGNRLQQIIDGDTTDYLYDAANRLEQASYQSTVTSYQFDYNGNLTTTGALTTTWDAANRLTSAKRDGTTIEPIYNGVNDRVGQVSAGVTTTLALDSASALPEVIYTSDGEAYLHLPGVIVTENIHGAQHLITVPAPSLHLPGVIVTENISGEVRYLLGDGLGSVRQAVDESAEYVASGTGASLIPVSLSFSKTNYRARQKHRYVPEGLDAREEHIKQMKDDIQSGVDSPGGMARPYSRWGAVNRLDDVWKTYEHYFKFQYHLYQPPSGG